MKNSINILLVGDVVGRSGRRAVKELLPKIKSVYEIDFTVVNIENASSGQGLTIKNYNEFLSIGIDVMTSGNHILAKKEIKSLLNARDINLIRPANFPEGSPGKGFFIKTVKGVRIAVINLMGRLFAKPVLDCPFKTFDSIYDGIKDSVDIVIVDLHAEATSEKQAFGWYALGRASVVVGTHTHVQTSDSRILRGKTAYITDLGMTGALDSVIGFKIENAIKRFLVFDKINDEVADGNIHLQGMVVRLIKGEDGFSPVDVVRIDERL